LNDDFLSSAHKIFLLSISEIDREIFIPDVDLLIEEDQDVIMNKTYYSGFFADTNLAGILKDVKEVHTCDLMTNVCIQATASYRCFLSLI